MYSKSIDDIKRYSYSNITELKTKRVLLRSCLNVTTDSEGKMTENTRYKESLPLIIELAQQSRRLVIMGHLGRPEKREERFSFKNNVYASLQSDLTKIGKRIVIIERLEDIPADDTDDVYLIDNIRFFAGEESKDTDIRMTFAKELSRLADVFVNDAFADYRESASTYDIATLLPSYIGSAFQKEVTSLSQLLNPTKPFVAVLGGAKLSEKLDALKALASIADKVLVGGAMAYTLLKAQGFAIGNSLHEDEKLQVAREIMSQYEKKLVLPVDHMVAEQFDAASPYRYVSDRNVPDNTIAIDIGLETIKLFQDTILSAQTIVWNGPLGVFEFDHSSHGTLEIGKAISDNSSAYALAGGGDSITAINQLKLSGFDHISTGGGAMLAYLSYEVFPTLDVIVK